MGQRQSAPGGGSGDKKDDKDKKKKYEPPVPTRVGKKKRKAKGPDSANKLPSVTPHTRCRLRQLKLERIKVSGTKKRCMFVLFSSFLHWPRLCDDFVSFV